MKHNILKIGILLFSGLFSFQGMDAQDLMAAQAPVDRQLKAVDSVSLQRAIKRELSVTVSDLYPTWTNDYVNAYKDMAKPTDFKISLQGFSMPTPSRQITSRYGYRSSFRRNHYGLDIKVYTGDTIYAAFDGKARIVSYERRGYGYYIVLRHPNGLETVYGHLSKQLIAENDIVKSGDPIGLGGSTGRSTGSHLHFETRFLGEPINPELLFDFPNQDVTNDYYVYHNSRGVENFQWANAAEAANSSNNSQANSSRKSISLASSKPVYHKVRKGDTLFSIAKKNSITVDQLCALNGIKKKSTLRAGQILKCR
ncbi:MAG: peptidoglycan DD-metalloendopeptidase family protein [Bacteroidaceae bacterium]|nr:peptidoglycan DD-metalloendopeptidase family protein [Bacteroidaceae bacterium]